MLAPLMPALPNGADACILFPPLLYALLAVVGALCAVSCALSFSQLLIISPGRKPVAVFFVMSMLFSSMSFAMLVLMVTRPEYAVNAWAGIIATNGVWGPSFFFANVHVLLKSVQRMGGTFSLKAAMGNNYPLIATLTALIYIGFLVTLVSIFACVGLPAGSREQNIAWRAYMACMAMDIAVGIAFGEVAIDMLLERINAVCAETPEITPLLAPAVRRLRRLKLVGLGTAVVNVGIFTVCAVILPYYYFMAAIYVISLQLIVIASTRVYGRRFTLQDASERCFIRWMTWTRLAACFDDKRDVLVTTSPPQAREEAARSLITVDVIMLSMFDSSSSSGIGSA